MSPTFSHKQQVVIFISIAVLFAALVGVTGYLLATLYGANRVDDKVSYSGNSLAAPNATSTVPETKSSDIDRLVFLIEEEKLAHDVYTKLYEKYGVRVFSSIARSETTHQNRIMELLDTRAIDDPRSAEVGVFKNADLQKLYDTLIAQGYQNVTEAYKVGVAIEQKDIADIEQDLKNMDNAQTDVVDALNALLRGSQNHLQAFNRQLG
jgi:hypothetical protein